MDILTVIGDATCAYSDPCVSNPLTYKCSKAHKTSTRTAQHNPCPEVQTSEREVKDLAADVVEVDVEVPDMLLEVLVERRALVVERLRHADLLLKPVALFLRAGDRVHLGALLEADLADDGAGCARCTGHYESLPCFDLANVEQALCG